MRDGLVDSESVEFTGFDDIDHDLRKMVVVSRLIDRKILITRTEAEKVLNER